MRYRYGRKALGISKEELKAGIADIKANMKKLQKIQQLISSFEPPFFLKQAGREGQMNFTNVSGELDESKRSLRLLLEAYEYAFESSVRLQNEE